VQRILDGIFAIGERLPPERELASQLGITRPTLREAMRHLEQEGWLLVQHGKPTVVRDFWREGGLNVLSRIVHHQQTIKPAFITNLLQFRLILAPTYTRDAITHNAAQIRDKLGQMPAIDATPLAYARFDWQLQHLLTVVSENVLFPLILNGFTSFYERMAVIYFSPEQARHTSHYYYRHLIEAADTQDSEYAYTLTKEVMERTIQHWQAATTTLDQLSLEGNDTL
ncbi:MAG: GntR family transcriptional regulator, partial [Chloroflexota bacterium]